MILRVQEIILEMNLMNKEKQIQIPESTFVDIYKLLCKLNSYELDKDTENIKNRLQGQIMAKFEAIEKRNTFTAYKTAAPMSQEREIKRQEYLEKAGISKNWRSEKEIHY